MTNDHDTRVAWLKMLFVWFTTGVGWITEHTTGQGIVLFLAGVHTTIQIYLLVRDRILRRRIERESQRAEFDSRPHHYGEPK